MTTRQTVALVVLLAVLVFALQWVMEDFRQKRIMEAFRAEWANVPTAGGAPDAG